MITLDLHGVKHEDAERKISAKISENMKKETTIRFITGHSKAMYGIVIQVASDYGLRVSILRDTEIVIWTKPYEANI